MTKSSSGKRLAILGGGMAGLTAAWELARPGVESPYDSITVYQRGHRLGGKGASSRGRNDRIEEHGLHVWLGYYDNAFRTLRECYAELDRPATDPDCPVQRWTDAFVKSSNVGVTERVGGGWENWIAHFSENELLPGEATATSLDSEAFVRRSLELLSDFFLASAPPEPSLYFSASSSPSPLHQAVPSFRHALRSAHLGGLALLAKTLTVQSPASIPILAEQVEQLRLSTSKRLGNDRAAQRAHVLVDLVTTCLLGMVADGVVNDIHALRRLDEVDLREWLTRHGALESTVESGLVRGLYDLVFAYEDGDTTRPSFPAGLGLFLAGKIFFDYKGAIFWKMTAGMGDVVFAPMYQVLRERGVDFRFFHRVEDLHLSPDGATIDTIRLTEQTPLLPGSSDYDPLRTYGGLPCFPARADRAQLAHPEDATLDFESHYVRGEHERPVTLRCGLDFDDVVLATSIGALPVIASELLARVPGWRDMIEGVPTVATQALQIWATKTEAELGCPSPGGSVSAYVEPFDTWASMTHLLRHEAWSEKQPTVGTIAYFCSPLATDVGPDSEVSDVERQRHQVAADAASFLEGDVAQLLPQLEADDIADRYVRANVDPSDRYVRSQPGTTHARLRPDTSGVDNMVLAGDWTDCGLNAGCIEAATLSGVQAANALLGEKRSHRILGHWPGLQP